MDGFWDGVQYYNSKHGTNVQVLGWNEKTQKGSFTGNFTNQTKGQTLTQTFISEGADVIFPVAGNVGLGAAKAVQDADSGRQPKVNMEWVDTDGCVSAPQYCKYFITSVRRAFTASVKTAVLSAAQPARSRAAPTSARWPTAAPCSRRSTTSPSKVPAALQSELKQIRQGIESGTIQTPTKSPV